jgi:hypothetical protein
MKLCPECKSDSLVRTSSTGLRVIVCVVLLFIPYGLFFCWIPFVFPHSYRCNICGAGIKEHDLLSLDWRERDVLTEKHRQLEAKLSPMLEQWVEDQQGSLGKIVKSKGQFLLLQVAGKDVNPFRIVDYAALEQADELVLSEKVSAEFKVFGIPPLGYTPPRARDDQPSDQPHRRLTELGRQLLSEREVELITAGKGALATALGEERALRQVRLSWEKPARSEI